MPKNDWRPFQLKILRLLYPDWRAIDLVKIIGRSRCGIEHKAKDLGIRKSAKFYASKLCGRITGAEGTGVPFKKGNRPWNKGIPFHSGGRSIETQFKKGNNSYRRFPPELAALIRLKGIVTRKLKRRLVDE